VVDLIAFTIQIPHAGYINTPHTNRTRNDPFDYFESNMSEIRADAFMLIFIITRIKLFIIINYTKLEHSK
jgi:hypothetical protein